MQAFWNKYCHFFVKTSFSVPLSNFRHGSSQSKRTSRGPEQGYQSFQRNLLTRFQHTSSISLNFFQKLLSGGPVSCLTWTWTSMKQERCLLSKFFLGDQWPQWLSFVKVFPGAPVSLIKTSKSCFLGDQCHAWLGPQIKKGSVLASKEARTLPFRKPFKQRTTCLTDKTNHPVKGLSLNRSQYGSCSTKYNTPAGT